ncbi:unnamed protein product [Kuraishia capsulata CBS 1993]|uniref:Uncharacterized protein n=1 Tax=Kuraishia capsulata CBS 1993 TaxID=1382522 RepID=W6MJ47_9ASCO|nr:uncharacterized protein KUCA_T00002222001 [Kuraishia capsulata CBS 1993]CDK26251.1 unnamed protein product [Kuraishia capsulata CBS 1993]
MLRNIICLTFLLSLISAAPIGNYTGVDVSETNGTDAKGSILYIFRSQWKQRDVDFEIRDHLVSTGYNVTFADQTEDASIVDGHDLVVISATIRSRDFVPGDYKDIEIPIFTWENDILDDLRFTGKCRDTNFGGLDAEHYVQLVNAPHPISAGVESGVKAMFVSDQEVGFGQPGLGADIIGTVPGTPDQALIFSYEEGATMDYDFIAPARRVFFGMGNAAFGNLTDAGLAIFDAAVEYAIGITDKEGY